MKVHLVDGTFELFRAYYGAPSAAGREGQEVGATRALLRSLLSLITQDGATHVAVAFDHVIESFRNALYAGYKTGDGIEPALYAQFNLAEEAAHALGLVVWSMVEFEADDALATGAARFAADPRVEQVLICSPDKDLAQCVRAARVVTVDRIRKTTRDEAGVRQKFGVGPDQIPEFLALVGDSADGYPGLPRFGEKTAAALLAAHGRAADIPADPRAWKADVRGAAALAATLAERREELALYTVLATLRTDVPLAEDLDALEWRGARRPELEALLARLGDPDFLGRVPRFV